MYTSYIIKSKVREAENIVSIYLERSDGNPLATFHPGQYLQIKIKIGSRIMTRNYTLSDRPGLPYYRITVKKEEGGEGSSALHGYLPGDVIEGSEVPMGDFYLSSDNRKPLVLLSAGVGITPMLSILNHLAFLKDDQEVWFIHSARERGLQIMPEQLNSLKTSFSKLNLHLWISGEASPGGRLNIKFLKGQLSGKDYCFFICGPASFNRYFREELLNWGINREDIKLEYFNSGPINSISNESFTYDVTFSKSNTTASWENTSATLLDFAESKGIMVDYSCRMGSCVSCETRIIEGTAQYLTEPMVEVAENHLLLCCSAPASNLILDL